MGLADPFTSYEQTFINAVQKHAAQSPASGCTEGDYQRIEHFAHLMSDAVRCQSLTHSAGLATRPFPLTTD